MAEDVNRPEDAAFGLGCHANNFPRRSDNRRVRAHPADDAVHRFQPDSPSKPGDPDRPGRRRRGRRICTGRRPQRILQVDLRWMPAGDPGVGRLGRIAGPARLRIWPGTAPRLFSGLLAGLGAAVALVGVLHDGPAIEK